MSSRNPAIVDSAQQLDSTIHAIYDASLAPDRWPKALELLASVTHSRRALIFTFTRGPSTGGFVFAHNFPAEQLAIWGAKSVGEDPFAMEGLARGIVVDGAVIRGDDLVPREVARRHAAVQEVWKPLGIDQMCCGIIFGSSDAHKMPACVALYRTQDDPPFEPETLEVLRRLVGHVARSLGVMFHLRDSRLQLAATRAALDQLSSAVYLLDPRQRVLHANVRAQKSTGKPGSVWLSDSGELGLAPGFRHREAEFRRALHRAVSTPGPDDDVAFDGLVLDDERGRPLCVVHAAPLSTPATLMDPWPMAAGIVFAYHLAEAPQPRPESLMSVFGLTPAEARAAVAVLGGGTVAEMAERLDVSDNTLKTQLKAVYAKTHTQRMADLLKLLLHLGHIG